MRGRIAERSAAIPGLPAPEVEVEQRRQHQRVVDAALAHQPAQVRLADQLDHRLLGALVRDLGDALAAVPREREEPVAEEAPEEETTAEAEAPATEEEE